MNEQRLNRVLQRLESMGLEQMLICDPMSIKYLCGYYVEPMERFLGLTISTNAEPTLFVNQLFPAPEQTTAQTVILSDNDSPIPALADAINAHKALGVDKGLEARWLVPLIEAQAAQAFRLSSDAVDGVRRIKDKDEQELMRAASRTNDKAMAWLKEQTHVSAVEREIAAALEGHYRELGAEGNSFTPIVSFGATAADPHHEPDGTVAQTGDVILFDVGCIQDGYCSDMTRTFFLGEPSERDRKVYDIVRRAHAAGESAVKPGVALSEIDRAARSVIEEAGYGQYFTHRLGHQIGTSVHEVGDVSEVNIEMFAESGMCFSIEPGIYLPGEMGVRIEDLVLVTEDGCEVLNEFPTELQVL
ncbi:MAG: aminopeptidase P family protein [Atopobiaceae bacterium]|nr:aminopeptidase P family protein [Atopobiaceae bacterium]